MTHMQAVLLSFVATVAAGCADRFLERAAREPDARRDPSGIVIRPLHAGDGAIPLPEDRVKVHYEGAHEDGKVFDSSRRRGEPLVFQLSAGIPCWRQALTQMKAGTRARIVCPWYTTFATKGYPASVPRDATLAFDLELIAIEGAAARASGDYKLRTLTPGSGDKPTAGDKVKVHYQGKLADGTIFDSSLKLGAPVVLPLSGVIPCWRRAIPRMQVGEKAELVCPPDLAYGTDGSPPTIPPNATLTFEIELIGIER